jgi:HK97 family phage major capsid protein
MAIVGRTGTTALIPEDVQKDIVEGALNKSAVRQLMKTVPMSTQQQRIPVFAAYPTASWLASETSNKPTTTLSWDNVYMYAEEIATIVVIPISLIKDVKYALWDEITPKVQEAFAIALDDTILFGTNKPASWPTAIVPAAVAASNQVVAGTSAVDTLEDINQVLKAVEDDGFNVSGLLARSQFKAFLRGVRDANKGFLYPPAGPANVGAANAGVQMGELYGEKLAISQSGIASFATSASNYSLIAGDWRQALLGIREDVDSELFREGVVTNDDGTIQYNLMTQDLVAMRFVGRFGFAVPNPVNRMNTNSATRYPFAVLKQRASSGGE